MRTTFENGSIRPRFRGVALAVVTLAALASPLMTTAGNAAMVGACGGIVPIPAPTNLREGSVEASGLAHAFLERSNVTLGAQLAADAVTPGLYASTSSLPATKPKIASGTRVDSYMLHSDPVGQPTSLPGNRFPVRVSFDSNILGVIVTDGSLNGSDAAVGVPGGNYPVGPNRGLDLGPHIDKFTIVNSHTLEIDFHTTSFVDEARIVVAHSTAPGFAQAYSMANTAGQVVSFGPRAALGNAPAHLASPVNAASETCTGQGYWLGAGDGGIFAFGDAHFFGSMGGRKLNQPIVGMTATPTDQGYWMVASDGGIFSFGDARFFGSMGAHRLNQPMVGMTTTPSGRGYRMVASDGGIFSFGDAQFYGSTGAIKLNQPIVGMTPTPSGKGYWMVARDGGIFSFGDAHFFGSMGGQKLNQPIVGMKSTPDGLGYWLVASDGGVFKFGDAVFQGSGVGRISNVAKIF